MLITDDADARRLARPRPRRDGRLLPAAHAERPRRRRRLELPRPTASRATPSRRSSIVSGDEAAADPSVRALAEHAEHGDRDRHVRGVVPRPRRPRPPGHELPRARRHDGQPRGPPPAPAPRGDRALPRRARLDREARRAVRRRALAARLASSSRRSPAICYGGISFGEIGEHAPLPAARPRPSGRSPSPPAKAVADGHGPAPPDLPAALLRARRRADARARVPAAATARSSSPAPTRGPRKIARRRHRHASARTAPRVDAARADRRATSPPAPSAIAARATPTGLHELVEVTQVIHRTSPGGSR